MWLAQEVIRQKRDGLEVSAADLQRLVRGIADDSLSEGQIAAFAMATLLRGMTAAERTALTLAMRDSGQVLHWDLPGPVVDKHSTGGVGDLTSLVLAPLLAACGCHVPMISGRGLGHTGGTLDKLESIPGYRIRPGLARFRQVVAEVGCAIVGPDADLAPADRRLYAIRDVTATVESVDLITASILAKKLAAGLDVLVMDVKTGGGAFMAEQEAALRLADSIVEVAEAAGVRTRALVTDMGQPLARSAGNALEVEEAIALLAGEVRSARLWQVIQALAEETLQLAGLADDAIAAERLVLEAWQSGAALARFAAMNLALGGPSDLTKRPWQHLPRAPIVRAVHPARPGWVQQVDTRALGLLVVELGGGRQRPEDKVDPAVGLADLALPGEWVDENRPLGLIHAGDAHRAARAARQLQAAYVLGEERPADAVPVVLDRR
ncbi:thymidine phosphorylase [Pseudomonas sp. SORGH_AS199]|jgi:thymidine phosphorylase|uniref:thymidine phosphorylase n=1 Tax=Pseudomonas TaxID=286 RepID=UPI00255376AE|nr:MULTISPECIES: thymidine phosphorylase [Pseudomonas]MDK8266985.1 thymidine phosphorylase [Pseudomonas oryzihabitans]MDR6227716.1 thymidine phosphorylase [Pseudomonas sp. SORGH_AS_0199]